MRPLPVLLVLLTLLAAAAPAQAHMRACLQPDGTILDRGGHGRPGATGASGDCPDTDVVEFVIGWTDEPPFAGFKNALDLSLRTPDANAPVADATLNATYTFGNESFPLALRAQFGRTGAFTDDIIPTRPGTYALRVAGSVTWANRTWPVDLSIQPATVEPPRDIEFPARATDPGGASAQELDALGARVAALERRATEPDRSAPGLEPLLLLAGLGLVALARRRPQP